jgi:hypothetical protein
MAPQSAEKVTSLDELDYVFDGDAHVTETVDDLVPYLEDRFSDSRRILSYAQNYGTEIYSNTMPTPGFEQRDYDTRDQNAKLQELEEFGLDGGIVGPTLNLNIATVDNDRIAVALANAYNSWVLDEILDQTDALFGTILVAPHDPEAAAEEIDDRASESDMRGVYLPDSGVVPPLGHRMYDPIYEAAERHDLPMVIHSSTPATTNAFPTQRFNNQTYAEEHVISHPFTHMWNLTTMLFRGVPDRFPDLEFVIQEAGIGWIPYLMWRLDDHYLEFDDEIPYLDKLPSKYFADRFYFTTQPLGHTARNGAHLAWALEMAGPDSVMYSSDMPHKDFDPPSELFDRIRGHFDAETVRGVMGETAASLFDIDV